MGREDNEVVKKEKLSEKTAINCENTYIYDVHIYVHAYIDMYERTHTHISTYI